MLGEVNFKTIKNKQLELIDDLVASKYLYLVSSKGERIQLNPALVALALLILVSAFFYSIL